MTDCEFCGIVAKEESAHIYRGTRYTPKGLPANVINLANFSRTSKALADLLVGEPVRSSSLATTADSSAPGRLRRPASRSDFCAETVAHRQNAEATR